MIQIRHQAEKLFLNKLLGLHHNAFLVGDYVPDYYHNHESVCDFQVAGAMPLSLAARHPDFARKYTKFLTTGRWHSMLEKWNEITPLPLPG
jgi:hypothetical protein